MRDMLNLAKSFLELDSVELQKLQSEIPELIVKLTLQ